LTTADQVAIDLFGLDQPEIDGGLLAEKYDPTPNPHIDDPVAWETEVLGEHAWSKQREIAESVVENRYTAVQSAHDTGKSWRASRLVSWWLDVHPEGEAFAVTTAPTWPQVRAILWREIRRSLKKGSLRGRTTLNCEWYMGGSRIGDPNEELVAYGRKPADYDQAAFQGIHAKYVLVIIDEACGVPRLLFDAVDSLATNVNARVLAIGNPDDPASQFAQICKPGSGWNTIAISAFDTPAFTGEEVEQDLLDVLVSKEWVEERKIRWGEASPTYISKVLGQFPEIGEDTLIQPSWIKAAEINDLSGAAMKKKGQYGGDIARYGSDKTVIYRNRAGMIRKVHESAKKSTVSTAGAVRKLVKPHVGGVPIILDALGLGGGVVDALKEDKVKGIRPFIASARAFEPERFENRRAEIYWMFRDLMESGMIDLAPMGEDDELKSQMGSIKWELTSKGKIKIEAKDDFKKRMGLSPDHLDACVMSAIEGAAQLPRTEPGELTESGTISGDIMTREW
jgi:hypothetical protein